LSCHKRTKKARLNSLGYKLALSAKPFELASLKQRMLLNASLANFLTPRSLMPQLTLVATTKKSAGICLNPRHPRSNHQPTTNNHIQKSTLLTCSVPYPSQVLGVVKGIPAGKVGVMAYGILFGKAAALVKVFPEEREHFRNCKTFVKLAVLTRNYPSEQIGEVAHLKAVKLVNDFVSAHFDLVFAHGFPEVEQIVEVYQPNHNQGMCELRAFFAMQCAYCGGRGIHCCFHRREFTGMPHAVNRTVNRQ